MTKKVFNYNQPITVGNQNYKLVTCIVEGTKNKEITVGLIDQTSKNIWRTGKLLVDTTGWRFSGGSLKELTVIKIRLNNKHIYFELATGKEVRRE